VLFEQVSIRGDTARHESARRVLLMLLRIAIGAGLLAYLAKSGVIDVRALSKLFTSWRITLTAVTLLLVDSALMSVRLSWLFRPQGLNLRFGTSLKLALVGFFFSTFLPGAAGGDLSKLFYTTRGSGGRRIEIMTVVLLDRAIGLFSLLLLPLIFAPMFTQTLRSEFALRGLLLTLGLLALGVAVGFFLCLFSDPFISCLPSGVRNRLTKNRVIRQVRGAIAKYRKNLSILCAAVGLSLLANLSLVFVTILGAAALALVSWTPRMFLVIPIGHIVNSLPLTPGGLGVGETAFSALFNLLGLRGGAEALLCTRIWMAMIGLIGFVFYLHGVSRKVFDESDVADEPCSAVLGTLKNEYKNRLQID
jgi:glycosyltransferase 2 family protein